MQQEMFGFYRNALQGVVTNEPLCTEYKDEWRGCGDDKERLVKLALRQQSIPFFNTYCYKGKGLSKDFCKNEFKEYINGYTIYDADKVEGYTYGLFIDWNYDNELNADKNVNSIMWCDDVNVVVQETKCPVIYISNKSNVTLSLNGYNSIRIYLFDESSVLIDDADSTCDVVVYRFSDDCKVDTGKFCLCKNIKEFKKTLRL